MREEISLSELSRTIRRYVFLIVLMMALGLGASLAYMHYRVTPLYRSDSELIVSQVGEEGIQYNQIQMNIQLIKTYQSIITGSAVLNKASDKLDNAYSPQQLRSAIEVSQPENSQLFYVQATMESPEIAQQALEQVIESFQEVTEQIYPNSQVQIVVLAEPSLNKSKVSPSTLVYSSVGLILGLATSVTYILVKELLDTRIRDERFLEKLGLLNIGNIYELGSRDFKDPDFSDVLRIEVEEKDPTEQGANEISEEDIKSDVQDDRATENDLVVMKEEAEEKTKETGENGHVEFQI